MTQNKVGWRLEHHFTLSLYLLICCIWWCWVCDARLCQLWRMSGCQASGRADRGDNGEQHSGGALHIHTRTPCTLPTSRPLTFTWPHSHSQTLIHYTKEIEIELLNNFVRRNGVHIFHISCKADSQLVSEWFSAAVVTMYEHSMLLYTACRDLLMERDR